MLDAAMAEKKSQNTCFGAMHEAVKQLTSYAHLCSDTPDSHVTYCMQLQICLSELLMISCVRSLEMLDL